MTTAPNPPPTKAGGITDIPVLQKLRLFEGEARRRDVDIKVSASYLAIIADELERLQADRDDLLATLQTVWERGFTQATTHIIKERLARERPE